MTYKIGVIGSAGGRDLEHCVEQAREVGRIIAEKGSIVCTGACPGLPNEALLAAQENGGMTIGFSPAGSEAEHVNNFHFPLDAEIMIYTGFGLKGRNVINIRSCDAVIAVAGRIGTLNELTIAYDERKVIGLVNRTHGISEFQRIFTESEKKGGHVIADLSAGYVTTEVIKYLDILALSP